MFETVLRKLRSSLVAASFLAFFWAAVSLSQVPTQQQLDAYKNLSAEQQRAVLEAVSRGGSPRSGAATDRQLEFPPVIQPKQGSDEAEKWAREGRLKGGDTLLIYLELRKFDSQEDIRSLQQHQLQQAQQNQSTGSGPSSQPSAPTPAPISQDGQKAAIQRGPERLAQLEDLRDRIQRRNPFVLDANGALTMPETGPVPLAGLTVVEAQERLAAAEQLRDFRITIVRLPVAPQGSAALKPFGYDLFAGVPTTFAPATDVPVPAEYVVGPGDALQVQLIGNTKGTYGLVVDREGKINFPELGPIAVGGMQFSTMRAALERRVHEQMIGTQASITMGELRSIRIFVLGEVERPGSYTVSGLSTMTNALFASGGVKRIGSLRNIELKRNGTLVTKLDLYNVLLKGDTRADIRFLPGDVIFIPPVGATAAVSGEVRRPAIYELNGEKTMGEVIALAGGLSPQADPTLATVERIDEQRRRVTVDIDLSAPAGLAAAVRNSDVLKIPMIRPSLEQSVTLQGYVYRPGDFQYRAGMRLSDLLGSFDELRPNADQHYVLIRREREPDRKTQVFSADLVKALQAPGSSADIQLAPRDQVHVFDLESGRDIVVEPLMRELQVQSTLDQPTSEVRIGGRVKVPGRYPLEPEMRVSDLIRAGGSMDEAAYGGDAELTRYSVVNGEARQTELISIDLKKIRAGDASTDIVLRPFDHLVIREVPLWKQQESVELRGEVRFPGKYPIHRGETLRSVLERAGGLTDAAFREGAVFTRVELKERERKQLDMLANRMQSDIAQLSLQTVQDGGKDVGQALAVGQSMLAALKSTEPVGRLVIDLHRVVRTAPGSSDDLILKDGDLLVIPRQSQEVTVLGEVQSATSHFYRPSLDRDEYINMSGGMTQRADKKRIYIVKADGSVMAKSGNAWFAHSSTRIDAGDTVVVPLDPERVSLLPILQAVTSILSNLAISAAALSSL